MVKKLKLVVPGEQFLYDGVLFVMTRVPSVGESMEDSRTYQLGEQEEFDPEMEVEVVDS